MKKFDAETEKLRGFEREFQEIMKRDDINQDSKDINLSQLMIDMEREFKIPMLREEKYEEENKDVVTLYRKISKSRRL